MAYLDDFIRLIRRDTDYMLTVLGGGGAIVEGFKNIIYYSGERVELRTERNIIVLEGQGFAVSEIVGSTLILDGKLSRYEVLGV